jgi:HEAT repeat protein
MTDAEHVAVLMENLQDLSPIPRDELLLDEELRLTQYQEIVTELYDNSEFVTSNHIPTLLNAFGLGSGFGLYWTVLHILEQLPWEDLEPNLISALRSSNPGTRMWATSMLRRGKSKNALSAIENLLDDPEELIRVEAVLALGVIGGEGMHPVIERMRKDPSLEVRLAVEEFLV